MIAQRDGELLHHLARLIAHDQFHSVGQYMARARQRYALTFEIHGHFGARLHPDP